jgi:hypothetical protein
MSHPKFNSISLTLHRISKVIVSFIASSYFLKLVFAWFVIQAIFFAITVTFAIPPDERFHYDSIRLFAANFPSPIISSQEGFYSLGESVRNPFFLYYYLMSAPYLLTEFLGNYSYIALRLVNVGLGITTLYLLVKLARLVNITPFATNIALFALSSTVMFTFLFSSISYDNLFILLTVLALFLTLKFSKTYDSRLLFALVGILLLGILVKVTFIPVAALIALTLGITSVGHFRKKLQKVLSSFKNHRRINWLLLLLLILPLSLVGHRYVVNLVQYGDYAPECTQVLTMEQCRESALFVRNERIYGADRRAANLDTVTYASNWAQTIAERTYGVFAHKSFIPIKYVLDAVVIFIILGIIGVIRYWHRKDKQLSLLLLFCGLYTLIVFIENYTIYLASGRPDFALHGRYLFTTLPIVYLVLSSYAFQGLKRNVIATAGVAVLVIGIFFLASLPSYLFRVGPEWYTPLFFG